MSAPLHSEIVVANILAGVIGSYPLERQLIVARCEGTGGNVDRDRETGTGLPPDEIASRQDLVAAPRVYDPATAKYLAVNIQVTPGPDPNNPLGHAPQNLYYYPWPNGTHPTFVDDWSTASLMSLQNPVTDTPPSWTLLQFNFAEALTNVGGTIPLVINPNVAYTPYCTHDPSPTCTPPPTNISQEWFALPDNIWNIVPAFYYRVIVSGTVTAQ